MTQLSDECVVEIDQLSLGQRREASRWLKLGVLALAISGLFAILLVLSRSPGIGEVFPWVDFFHTSLVIHVDQSVLIWFLAMIGVIWIVTSSSQRVENYWHLLAFLLALFGALGIAASAFFGEGDPLMNNYVPVLQRPFFFYSLGAFSVGVILRMLIVMLDRVQMRMFALSDVTGVASVTIVLGCLVAFLCLLWTWSQMPAGLDGRAFYEYLFWGAGHTLQFAYTQSLLLAWLLLATACGVRLYASNRVYGALLLVGAVPVLFVPVIYFFYPAVSAEMRLAFTRLMQWGGGVAVVPIGLLLLKGIFSRKADPLPDSAIPLRNALWMSLLLFASGGIIGVLIRDVNTVIPAHYHGSIVGVTLALMGVAYLLMPKLGYPVVSGRLANIQPLVYGAGQLLHITGLAVSGVLGVQRKTAGAAQGLEGLGAKFTMGVMGIGGLLAVIGGILFVWIMWRGFRLGRNSH